jgi:hypothetical protein
MNLEPQVNEKRSYFDTDVNAELWRLFSFTASGILTFSYLCGILGPHHISVPHFVGPHCGPSSSSYHPVTGNGNPVCRCSKSERLLLALPGYRRP